MEQRLIDANALSELLKDERGFYKKMYDNMQQPCEQDERAIIGAYYTAYSKSYHIVKDAPTVDAVPVTRCAQCKWCDYPVPNSTKYGCRLFDRCVKGDWFCAGGERRSDGKEEC